MRKLILAAVLAANAATALPALADPPPWAPAHGRRHHDERYDDHHRHSHHRYYDSRGRYYEPRVITRRDYVWRGSDGRYYCRRSNGTTGIVVGAALGALLGHELDSGRDHTLGTVLGALGGGLLGREVDRGDLRCR